MGEVQENARAAKGMHGKRPGRRRWRVPHTERDAIAGADADSKANTVVRQANGQASIE